MHRPVASALTFLFGVGLVLAAGDARAAAPDGRGAADLTTLSLEELMSIEVTVTSAARHAQRLGDTPAAVFVLTGEEIRRSGATSIPDALRLVPGVQVARTGSNKWSVTARGFTGREANKLLVLFDGLSAYTPLFSGILWEREGVFLEDIDRIEVIRGPGAALWGANAVNGVINIITKPASKTQGGLVTATAGTEERGRIGARYGGRLGEAGHLRVYGEATARDAGGRPGGGSADDASRFGRTGFRSDLDLGAGDQLTVQGDLYRGRTDDTTFAPLFRPPYSVPVSSSVSETSGNLLGRWRRRLSDASHLAVQSYYQQSSSSSSLGDFREETFDIEVEHRLAPLPRHDVVWGTGARWYRSHIGPGGLIGAATVNRVDTLFSVFAQDEITLLPDRLKLTLGTKVEHNEHTGFEVQPNARLAWTPHPDHVVWAAVSRAVRTPSRSEQEFSGVQQVVPAFGGLPLAVALQGNPGLSSETLVAYEAGYRVRPLSSLSLDAAVFYNVYSDLRGFQASPPTLRFGPFPHLLLPVTARNGVHGNTYGIEVAAEWDVRPGWRLRGAYSALKMRLTSNEAATGVAPPDADAPLQQVVLRSSHDLSRTLQLDVGVRAVDQLRSGAVDGYVGLDVRLAWQPQENWEVALVGQNLIGRQHREAKPDVIDLTPSAVQRGVYAKLTRRF